MSIETIRHIASIILALTGAVVVAVVGYRLDGLIKNAERAVARIDSLAAASEDVIRDAKTPLLGTIRQIRDTAFEVKATAIEIKQEAGDPEDILTRKRIQRNTNVITGEITRGLLQFNDVAMPGLINAIEQARMLLANSDRQINTGPFALLPSVTRAASSSERTIDSLNQAIIDLSSQSTLTLQEARILIADPAWKAVAENLTAVSGEALRTSQNVTETTGHLNVASVSVEKIAADIREFTKTQAKGRKIVLGLQIVTALVPLLTFLR